MQLTQVGTLSVLAAASMVGLGSQAAGRTLEDISEDIVSAERISYSWIELGYQHSDRNVDPFDELAFDSFYASFSLPVGSYVYILGGWTYGTGDDVQIAFDSYSTVLNQFNAGLGVRVPFMSRSDFFIEGSYVFGEYGFKGYNNYGADFDGLTARFGYRERFKDWLYLEGDLSWSEIDGNQLTGFGVSVFLQPIELSNWVFSYRTDENSTQFSIGLRLLDIMSRISETASTAK